MFEKDGVRIAFNLKVKTVNGILWCEHLPRNSSEVAAVVTRSVSMNRLHDMLGHINETSCHAIAKHLNIHISKGRLSVCESCAIGKAKQKPLRRRKIKFIQGQPRLTKECLLIFYHLNNQVTLKIS